MAHDLPNIPCTEATYFRHSRSDETLREGRDSCLMMRGLPLCQQSIEHPTQHVYKPDSHRVRVAFCRLFLVFHISAGKLPYFPLGHWQPPMNESMVPLPLGPRPQRRYESSFRMSGVLQPEEIEPHPFQNQLGQGSRM